MTYDLCLAPTAPSSASNSATTSPSPSLTPLRHTAIFEALSGDYCARHENVRNAMSAAWACWDAPYSEGLS
jgi:hypothetical protein